MASVDIKFCCFVGESGVDGFGVAVNFVYGVVAFRVGLVVREGFGSYICLVGEFEGGGCLRVFDRVCCVI